MGDNVLIGGSELAIMAGLCSIEGEKQIGNTVQHLVENNIKIMPEVFINQEVPLMHSVEWGWIRTFEKAYRNTLDLNAIPILKEKTHLPVIVDPSHGIGLRQHDAIMSLATVVAGAD